MLQAQAEALCRDRGLRLTPNLRLILAALAAGNDHPDADKLWRVITADGKRVPLASVYRILAHLVAAGVVTSHHFGAGKTRYELATVTPHEHLIDLTTGEVLEFSAHELEVLEDAIADRLGYRIIRRKLELYGVPLHTDDRRHDKAN